MKSKSAGFTLLEIIIVMVIFGSILGIGIFSITNLAKTTTLSEATGDVISILKETQNLAKNNTIPKSLDPVDKIDSVYYYVLQFTRGTVAPYGNINRYLYARKDGNWVAVPLSTEMGIKSKLITQETSYGTGSGQCTFVMFEALTGDIKITTSSASNVPLASLYSSTLTSCNLSVILPTNDDMFKNIYINAAAGNFGVVGETQ